jgi:hypothetical protein
MTVSSTLSLVLTACSMAGAGHGDIVGPEVMLDAGQRSIELIENLDGT